MEQRNKTDKVSLENHDKDETLLTILQQQQKIIEQYVNKKNMQHVDNDANFEENSWRNITDRDIAYTGLLNHYTRITKIRNFLKEVHKWIYFWIIMSLIICFGIYVFQLLNDVDFSQKNSIENIVMMITSLVSFSSVVISIPLIITKYLFSSKEDKSIAKIILHTQDHDSTGRQWAIDFKKNITNFAYSPETENDLNKNKEKPPA